MVRHRIIRRVFSPAAALSLLAMVGGTAVSYANVVLTDAPDEARHPETPVWDAEAFPVPVRQADGRGAAEWDAPADPARRRNTHSIVYTEADLYLTGAWDPASSNDAARAFDFWADAPPLRRIALRVFDRDGEGWPYAASAASPSTGWTAFSAALAYHGSLWSYGTRAGGSEAIFLSDLQTLNWIGLGARHTNTAVHTRRLTNEQLMVPQRTP